MDAKSVIIIVYDKKKNFSRTKDFIADKKLVKNLICINKLESFEVELKKLNNTDYICLIVHVFYTQAISGIKKFVVSGIKRKYPLINAMYVSEGSSDKIKQDMLNANMDTVKIFKYHEILTAIEEDEVRLYTKKEIVQNKASNIMPSVKGIANKYSKINLTDKYPKIDYALITALYKDEFDEVKKIFKFPKEDIISTEKNEYHIGYLKEDTTKKIVAAIPNETGMVDSAIIATQMLEFFRPDYLLMSGVCGGGSDLEFGDIILASQIFTFQKGKISDLKKKDEKGELLNLELYDKNNQIVDYDHLYDKDGNQIHISIEKFEKELGSVLSLEPLMKGRIENNLSDIKMAINEFLKNQEKPLRKMIDITIAPIACSTMIINKEGYFDDILKTVDRKTAAVEMESYGVARACQFANDGKTKWVIFKSVMDKTKNKNDAAKRFAAHTSAQFLKELFLKKII